MVGNSRTDLSVPLAPTPAYKPRPIIAAKTSAKTGGKTVNDPDQDHDPHMVRAFRRHATGWYKTGPKVRQTGVPQQAMISE